MRRTPAPIIERAVGNDTSDRPSRFKTKFSAAARSGAVSTSVPSRSKTTRGEGEDVIMADRYLPSAGHARTTCEGRFERLKTPEGPVPYSRTTLVWFGLGSEVRPFSLQVLPICKFFRRTSKPKPRWNHKFASVPTDMSLRQPLTRTSGSTGRQQPHNSCGSGSSLDRPSAASHRKRLAGQADCVKSRSE